MVTRFIRFIVMLIWELIQWVFVIVATLALMAVFCYIIFLVLEWGLNHAS